jgi:16S rRNA (cytosine967-C5)-methyltransferase
MSEDGRDARDFAGAPFARVLVDAPCSGIGALRRRPEARWRKREDDLIDLTVLQGQLLDAALDATEVNGYVAYVTCSPDARETVDVIDATLAGRDDVEVVDTGAVFDTLGPTEADFRRGTAVQLWPHRHNTDAMFIQLLRRTG